MTIRDRGMVKWQTAFQVPGLVKTQRDLWHDTERIAKRIVDEQEAEVFDIADMLRNVIKSSSRIIR